MNMLSRRHFLDDGTTRTWISCWLINLIFDFECTQHVLFAWHVSWRSGWSTWLVSCRDWNFIMLTHTFNVIFSHITHSAVLKYFKTHHHNESHSLCESFSTYANHIWPQVCWKTFFPQAWLIRNAQSRPHPFSPSTTGRRPAGWVCVRSIVWMRCSDYRSSFVV